MVTPVTDWTRPCAFCGASFVATMTRAAYCSRLCRDKHKWFGVVPYAHRSHAARVARP